MLSASVGPSNALLLSSGIASSAFAKPLGAAAPLRIGPVEDLVPPGELRVIGVGEMLGDDALEVGVDHGPVERAPLAVVGKRFNGRQLPVECPYCRHRNAWRSTEGAAGHWPEVH